MMIDIRKAGAIYRKSVDILKSVQLKNGGCLATPRGERYPYIYPRDHAAITLGFLSAGLFAEAKKALAFVLKCNCTASGAFPQRIDMDGNDASYKPVQIDGTAMILYTLSEYINRTNDLGFAGKHWEIINKAVSYIINNFHEDKQLVFTPNSIHEFPPTEKGLEIWANAACCSALQRMYELSVLLHDPRAEWEDYSNKIRSGIQGFMWNSRIGAFVKNIRLKESSSVLQDPDASKYAVADFGVLPDSDVRIKTTVRHIEKALWHKELGGICRYPKYEGRNNGGWGPWPHFTLMLCRHFINTGNRRKADKYLDWVISISYKNMLPEHISLVSEFEEYVSDFTEAGLLRDDRMILINNARKHPMFRKGLAYITTPLAWPHAEFIRTFNLYREKFKH